jgi:hypothetical protein
MYSTWDIEFLPFGQDILMDVVVQGWHKSLFNKQDVFSQMYRILVKENTLRNTKQEKSANCR